MVKKVLRILNKEFHGINEAALLLGSFAFLSQILGLIRDRLLAHTIGPGPILDVYYASFRIPDFLFVSVASLVSITALMPFIVKKIKFGPSNQLDENCDKIKAKNFLNNIFSAFMIFMVLVSFVIFIFMPYLTPFIAPGFSESQLEMLTRVSRIMLLSPIFIGLSNLIGTITQLFKNFFVFSLSPVFYNLGIIIGIVVIYPIWGIDGLAIGVILGAILHALIQFPTVIQHGFFPKFNFKINWKEVYSVIRVSLPRTLTLSMGSLVFMVLIAIASKLKPGSISLFTFSYNLQSVPVGIIGFSYSVAAFPTLVKSFSFKNLDNFIDHIILTAKQIIFWSLPVIILMVVLRAQIVRVVLGVRTFSWADTRLTAASVALFVISLLTQSLVLLFVRGYYAAGNTKKPLFINVFSSIMVIFFALILLQLFKIFPELLRFLEIILRVADVSGTFMLALPISFALGSILNFLLIWRSFKKDFLRGTFSGLSTTFYQILAGSIVMGAMSYLMLNIFDHIFVLNTFIGIFLHGFISGIIGIIAGVVVLILLKNKELKDIIKALKQKFWKKKVLSLEQQNL